MTCREIPADVLRTAEGLDDVYSGVGALKTADGRNAPPPRELQPEGFAAGSFPYMAGADKRSFDLSSLYANDKAALQCLLNGVGYNRDRVLEIDREVKALGNNEAAITDHLNSLSALDQRIYSIFRTLNVLEYFRTRGNTDRNQNIVSAREIESWAWVASGRNREKFGELGGKAIARLHALLGLAHFLGTEPPAAAPAAPAAGAAAVCECREETVRNDALLEQLYDCDQELDVKQADIDQKLDELVTCNEENGRLDAEMARLQGENVSCQARLPVAEGDLALCAPELLICQTDFQEEVERRQLIEADYLFCWSDHDAQAMEMAELRRENDMLRMAVAACEERGPGTDLSTDSLPGGVPDAGMPRLE